MLNVKMMACRQLWICHQVNPATKNRMTAYTSHLIGSRNRTCSTARRNVYNGEIFLTLTSGNKAKSNEITTPDISPCDMAFHDMVVVTCTGKKSLNTAGNC